jgi:single-strand DNA-binding protein
MSINKAIVVGNLGRDPEVRALPSGQNVASFSVATKAQLTDRNGDRQERTEWHRVVAFGKLADNCQRLLSKGRQVVCCESVIGDGGGPPGVGLQERIPNHPELRG